MRRLGDEPETQAWTKGGGDSRTGDSGDANRIADGRGVVDKLDVPDLARWLVEVEWRSGAREREATMVGTRVGSVTARYVLSMGSLRCW